MSKTDSSFGGFGILNFIREESMGGFILIVATIIALVWANSPYYETYHHLWHEVKFGISLNDFSMQYSLHHWINDGLMAIFFFGIGLEIKREIIGGELSTLKKASVPVMAALGGMMIPAGFFVLANWSKTGYLDGWGIPMATDIAFALGILSLLGSGFLAGIGFTMSIFISDLAYIDEKYIQIAKVGIFTASLLAAITGLLILRKTNNSKKD